MRHKKSNNKMASVNWTIWLILNMSELKTPMKSENVAMDLKKCSMYWCFFQQSHI